jgi:hypothetical protein
MRVIFERVLDESHLEHLFSFIILLIAFHYFSGGVFGFVSAAADQQRVGLQIQIKMLKLSTSYGSNSSQNHRG